MHSCTRREEVDQAKLLEDYKKLFEDPSTEDAFFYAEVVKLQLQMTLPTKLQAMVWHDDAIAKSETSATLRDILDGPEAQ